MFDIPMRGLRDRFNRWNQIAVAARSTDRTREWVSGKAQRFMFYPTGGGTSSRI
jgi:hypothetical protein